MNNFAKRLISFGIGIALLAGLMALAHFYVPAILPATVAIAVMLGCYETVSLMRAKGMGVSNFAPAATIIIYWVATRVWKYQLAHSLSLIACAIGLVFFIFMVEEMYVSKHNNYRDTLSRLAASFFAVLYPGMLGLSLFALVSHPSLSGKHTLYLIYFLAMVFANDTFAYLTGMLLGASSRGIFPPSPNKSLAGLIGGVVATILVAKFGAMLILGMNLDWYFAAMVGAAIAILAVAGDLFESMLKRSAGVKDSGRIFPGMGGILDRLDSILFAAPAFLLLLVF